MKNKLWKKCVTKNCNENNYNKNCEHYYKKLWTSLERWILVPWSLTQSLTKALLVQLLWAWRSRVGFVNLWVLYSRYHTELVSGDGEHLCLSSFFCIWPFWWPKATELFSSLFFQIPNISTKSSRIFKKSQEISLSVSHDD